MIILQSPLKKFELRPLKLQGQNFTIELAPDGLANFYAKILKLYGSRVFFFPSILMHYQDASKMTDCWLFWQAN